MGLLTKSREIDEKCAYYNVASPNVGVEYPVGTREMPVNNVGDLEIILLNRRLTSVKLLSDILIDTNMPGIHFEGDNDAPRHDAIQVTCAGGVNLDGCSFSGVYTDFSAACAGAIELVRCYVDSMDTNVSLRIVNCIIGNLLAITIQSPDIEIMDSEFDVEINLSSTNGQVRIARCSEASGINFGVHIQNLTNGAKRSSIELSGGEVIIDASCTAGQVDVYGTCRLTDNGGGIAVNDYTILSGRSVGKLQMAETTIDLNQVAGDYDLFTGTDEDVILEALNISMPNAAAGGALTSISIQTDHTTPQVIIDNVVGAVADLTAEAQLYWTGKIRINVGDKIQLSIAGGATGVGYVCSVNAQCRAVADGGYLS